MQEAPASATHLRSPWKSWLLNTTVLDGSEEKSRLSESSREENLLRFLFEEILLPRHLRVIASLRKGVPLRKRSTRGVALVERRVIEGLPPSAAHPRKGDKRGVGRTEGMVTRGW